MIVLMTFDDLFGETFLLFQALKRWGESLHRGLGVSAPMRGVLELLLLSGPTTVPGMARARGVSRQHIQQQVDALLERRWVARLENPAHKRSSLIELTDEGRALVENMRAAELDALTGLQAGVSDDAVSEAAQVLAAWRRTLRADAERRSR